MRVIVNVTDENGVLLDRMAVNTPKKTPQEIAITVRQCLEATTGLSNDTVVEDV